MGVPRCLAVVAALALPAVAFAQLPPSTGGRAALAGFNRLDRDGDHALSVAELRRPGRERGAEALFVLLDGDGDGRLSLKELGVAGAALLTRFDAYDVNKDGFVTRREFPNFVDPVLLAALDRNGDGKLSLAELRPGFAGARAVVPAAQAPARPPAKTAEPTRCWVTGFGGHRWTIEAPVVWAPCRTR